jgi:quinol monooxygenase YgiN
MRRRHKPRKRLLYGDLRRPTLVFGGWHVHCNVQRMNPSNDNGVLTCSITMRFAPATVEQAVQLLLSAVGRTESKTGCVACSVGRDAAEPARVRYDEAWTTEHEFRRHVQSEEFRRILVAMEMASEEPRVTIGTLSGRAGIEFLEDLHGNTGPGLPDRDAKLRSPRPPGGSP